MKNIEFKTISEIFDYVEKLEAKVRGLERLVQMAEKLHNESYDRQEQKKDESEAIYYEC